MLVSHILTLLGVGGKLSQGPSEIKGHTGILSPGLTCLLDWGQGTYQAFPNTGTWPSTSDQVGISHGPVLAELTGWGYP